MTERFLTLGPRHHGVVRHAQRLASAGDIPAVSTVDELPAGAVVHLDLTDRLLAARSEDAADAAAALFDALDARRARVVIGLHDVPCGAGDPRTVARAAAYRRLGRRAAAVVACSTVEAELLDDLGVGCDAVLPLPVSPAARPSPAPAGSVTVLGYLWPGRGHEEVLAALPPGVPLRCVGRAAEGHQDLADALAADPRVHVTGYLPDAQIPAWLTAATIPVAPNRALAASASICEWWGHGRRPLVPATRQTAELLACNPGSLLPYEDLRAALASAAADPASTYLPAGVRPGPDLAAAVAARLAVGR